MDTLVLKLSCQKAIEGFDYFIQTHDVWEQVDAVGVPLVEFNDRRLEEIRARTDLLQHARREVDRLHLIVRLLGTQASEGIER